MLTVPEQIQTNEERIADQHNKMLIMDQNYARVKSLHDSEVSAIAELQNIKATLNDAIDSLESRKENIEGEVKDLEEKKNTLNKNISDAKTSLIDIKAIAEETTAKHVSREKLIALRESDVLAREASVSDREEEVREKESVVAEKHKKIKEFKDSI